MGWRLRSPGGYARGIRAGRGARPAGRAAAVRSTLTLLALAALLLAALPAQAQSDRDGELERQGLVRHYELHLPPGVPDGRPRPLVLALHGLDPRDDWHAAVGWLRASWTMDAVADREGFAVAYPAALGGRWSYSPQRPVPVPGRAELVDDEGFLLASDHVISPPRDGPVT